MAEKDSSTAAFYRLAVLDSQPLRTPQQLVEWYRLRQWVLSDPRRLEEYQQQKYFKQMEEITKVQKRPPTPSLFLRLWRRLFPKG